MAYLGSWHLIGSVANVGQANSPKSVSFSQKIQPDSILGVELVLSNEVQSFALIYTQTLLKLDATSARPTNTNDAVLISIPKSDITALNASNQDVLQVWRRSDNAIWLHTATAISNLTANVYVATNT